VTNFIKTRSSIGHHDDYYRVFAELCRQFGYSAQVTVNWRSVMFSGDSLFFMMMEETPIGFVLTAPIRSLLGRKTSCLLFRPGESVHPKSLIHQVKRALLQSLRRLPGCNIITLLPFDLEPGFAAFANNWIYDPQLWDVKLLGYDAPPSKAMQEFIGEIRERAGTRKVVVALGTQNQIKGFGFFCQLWNSPKSEALRQETLFVSLGKVAPTLTGLATEFAENGGYLLDRMASNEELLALYQCTDYVWACYAPQYNQASGIYGRAVQFGVPTVVRSGSFLDRLSTILDEPKIGLAWGDEDGVVDAFRNELGRVPKEKSEIKVEKMLERSMVCLRGAISDKLA